MSKFTIEILSQYTTKVVENDRFGQYPFLYVIQGVDKIILIDTGCGENNYFNFVTQNLNPKQLPYLIINTHVHFDHVGGNHFFSESQTPKLLGICMSERKQNFTQNVEINSLCMAHNTITKPFKVTQWLKEGDLIYIDDQNKTQENALQILWTPGHTPDSIAIYSHFDFRLFVGDTIYPWTIIHLDCIGSNILDYMDSISNMIEFLEKVALPSEKFLKERMKFLENNNSNELKNNSNQKQLTEDQKQKILQLIEFLGSENDTQCSYEDLLDANGWNLELASNAFYSNPQISSLYPRKKNEPLVKKEGNTEKEIPKEIPLSCGHVEGNFPSSNLNTIKNFITSIVAGLIKPSHVEDTYGEFAQDSFNIMMSLKELENSRKEFF